MDQAWPVKVRFTRRALRQMAEILDYIEAQSPQGAETVERRLQAVIVCSLIIPTPDASPTRVISAASSRVPILM